MKLCVAIHTRVRKSGGTAPCPGHPICAGDLLLRQVLSLHMDFMGENKRDATSRAKKHERKGREIGLFHHRLGTMT